MESLASTLESRVETARLRALVESLGAGILVEDEMRRVSLANEAFCALFRIPVAPELLRGADCAAAALAASELVLEPQGFLSRIEELLRTRVAVASDEVLLRDGRVLERDYVPIVVDSTEQGNLWVYRDVTATRQAIHAQRAAALRDQSRRERAEALLSGEKRLLEMLSRGGPLPDVLGALCRLVEEQAGVGMCSVLLVDASGTALEHGAAPSLPAGFCQAIHGRPLLPGFGPCALAVCSASQVIAMDIQTDTRYDGSDFRELSLSHGLRACWSTPILSGDGKAVGVFAIYQREPAAPTPIHHDLIEQFTHLASVVIDRARSENALQRAQAELAHVTRVTTLGELAASIAHEINQPLAAMVADASASLNWLRRESPDLASVEDSLRSIVADGARAGEVLTRIRALLSRSTLAHERCDMGRVVAEAIELLGPALARQRTTIVCSGPSEGLEVVGDAVELQQVLVNLILNAAEAANGFEAERRRVLIAASQLRPRRRTAGLGCGCRSKTRVLASMSARSSGCSPRSIRRSQAAWAWVYRSCARSSIDIRESSGPARTPNTERRSRSRCLP
jgi:hypothetical protein